MNYKIRQLEDKIIEVLNQSDIPIEVKRLIIADISQLIIKKADSEIIAELQERSLDAESIS